MGLAFVTCLILVLVTGIAFLDFRLAMSIYCGCTCYWEWKGTEVDVDIATIVSLVASILTTCHLSFHRDLRVI